MNPDVTAAGAKLVNNALLTAIVNKHNYADILTDEDCSLALAQLQLLA